MQDVVLYTRQNITMRKLLFLACYFCILSFKVQAQDSTAFNNEYQKLLNGICNTFSTKRVLSDASFVFSIKMLIDGKGQVNNVYFSENTPEKIKLELAEMLRSQIKWNKLKPGGRYTVVLPVCYVAEKKFGVIQVNAIADVLYDSFAYSNGNLFGNKPVSNYILLQPLYCKRFIGDAPVDRLVDSTDLK
jgi:hypothetical protein